MNMVGGVVTPSSGGMTWRGETYAPATPADATARGIAFIHQELNLFTNLSIAENVFIDGFPRRIGLIDRAKIAETTRALLKRLDLDHSPDTVVAELAPGERQLVEIAKALHRDADLIILDEPTTSLTPRETARLFDVMARLKAEGRTLIYISPHPRRRSPALRAHRRPPRRPPRGPGPHRRLPHRPDDPLDDRPRTLRPLPANGPLSRLRRSF